MKKSKGFTLIELLVVIAIIGILAVLIFLALERSREATRDSQRKAFCRDVATAEAIYYDSHKTYTESLAGPSNSLVADGLIESSKIPSVCPNEDFGDVPCTAGWETALTSPNNKTFLISTGLERKTTGTFYCDQSGCADKD